MSSEAVSALADAHLTRLVQFEQVRQSIQQVRRIPLPHFLMDCGIAWTAWRAGVATELVGIWFVFMTIAQVTRTLHAVLMFNKQRLSEAQMLRRLAWWLTALGASHMLIISAVFAQPIGSAHYLLTMIMVGTAAGAITPAAGHFAAYVSWALVFGGALVLGWLVQGGWEGLIFAVLLSYLFGFLAFHVRDQGRALYTLMSLSESLRLERDRSEVQRQRAEAASEAKTRFFAAASHDLRQPLHALAINAATVQALAQRDADETLGRVSHGIRRALVESSSLLDSLLEVSQLDAGAVKVEWVDCDVLSVLHQVVETNLPVATKRGLDLLVRTEHEELWVHTDPDLFKRVVNNLVGNAIKFTTQGGVTLEVLCAEHPDLPAPQSRRVLVRVIDTGPGIALQEQEQVFEEFYQIGNPARDRSRGLGLGLSIVRRISKLIEAPIRLQSTPGLGCLFEISLQRAETGLARQDLNLAPASDVAFAQDELHVLIIDDEVDLRESLCTLLGTLGWQAQSAACLAEAQELLDRGFQPDVLLVDFRLRDGESGLDVLAALRSQGWDIPAVLVTGDTEPSRINAARSAGVPVIYKPVDGLTLAQTMSKLVKQVDHAVEMPQS